MGRIMIYIIVEGKQLTVFLDFLWDSDVKNETEESHFIRGELVGLRNHRPWGRKQGLRISCSRIAWCLIDHDKQNFSFFLASTWSGEKVCSSATILNTSLREDKEYSNSLEAVSTSQVFSAAVEVDEY